MTKTSTIPLDPMLLHTLYKADYTEGSLYTHDYFEIKTWNNSAGYKTFRMYPWPCTTLLVLHRVLWVMYHNYDIAPGWVIDHINRDRTDNRLLNLRCVTIAENNQNKSNNWFKQT